MVWQKIDDQFGISKKVIRIPRARRHQCAGLWLLALNYAGRALTDGVIEEHELDELGARPADLAELVRVDLWHAHGHTCDRCVAVDAGSVVIHDFLVYNPSKAKVESDRENERVRKMSQRDKKRDKGGTTTGVRAVSEHPGPVPIPAPETDDLGASSYVPDPSHGHDDGPRFPKPLKGGGLDLNRVDAAVAKFCDRTATEPQLQAIVDAVMGRAGGGITSMTAFVVKAIENDWSEWQAFIDSGRAAA